MQKNQRPPGGGRGSQTSGSGQLELSDHAPAAAAPQEIFVQHSQYAAIRVSTSRENYDLPRKPRKEGDRRARHITHTVEAEAMPAETLRWILRTNIEMLLPQDALKVTKIAEESEREGLRKLAEAMRETGYGGGHAE